MSNGLKFDAHGLMRARHASINDLPITPEKILAGLRALHGGATHA